ncbi:MAG: T9SS type A sorting domain-containing protein [Chitinophagales bacterium]
MKNFTLKILFILMIGSVCFQAPEAKAQCLLSNASSDTLNWDWQYFQTAPISRLPTSGIGFMFGVTSMNLYWRAAASNTNAIVGTNGTHTGSASSFGNGDDINFNVSAGTDSLVFADTVRNLKFSIHDIDVRQAVTITAKSISGAAIPITTLAKTNAASTLTIAGSGTNTASATFPSGTDIASTSNLASVNVTINGPVKSVNLAFTKNNTTPDNIWISDISACVVGSWPTNYQAVSTPEAGQPQYIMAVYGDSCMLVNMTTNTASLLFEDASLYLTGGARKMNSVAYDPYKQIVYYCDNDTSPPATNPNVLKVFKYDVKTGVKSTFINDVTTLGVMLAGGRLGSGGASFYNGSLFLGVDANYAAAEPTAVWRIDINSSGVATKASRFWSKQGIVNPFTGSRPYLYNMGDFVINDGTFYNFNAGFNNVLLTDLQHISLNTMMATASYTDTLSNGNPRPNQASIGYDGKIYNMTNGNYALYNGAGSFGATTAYTGSNGIIWDAGEAFKYPYDFGDAPTGYGVAYHLFRTSPNLMLGAAVDYEVNDTINPTANADDNNDTGSADDEDAVTSFPTLTVANASYTVPVRVTNSSGAAATLYGFLDFNRDGDFADAGETSAAAAVANGTTTATPINVTFTGLTGGSVGASFIRFRLATSASEAGSRSGYAATGEAEDYDIPIDASSLPVELVNFTATAKENNTTQLDWQTASELNNDYFEVQRSQNNIWETIGNVDGNGNSNVLINYSYIDNTPYMGINYYRLKQIDYDGSSDYSPVVSVKFNETTKSIEKNNVILYPNPAQNDIWIKTEQKITGDNALDVEVYNITGEKIYASKIIENLQRVDMSNYQKGMYFVKVDNKTYKILKE